MQWRQLRRRETAAQAAYLSVSTMCSSQMGACICMQQRDRSEGALYIRVGVWEPTRSRDRGKDYQREQRSVGERE